MAEAQELRQQLSVSDIFRVSRVKVSDGCELSVYTTESPSKPTVALLNAYGMPAEFFVPLAIRLKPHFNLMTWDTRLLPGVEGVAEDAACGVPRHADDLWNVCDALALKTPVGLVGWCTGATVALHAAATSNQVRALVLANGPFPDARRDKSDYERTMEVVMPLAATDANYAEMLVNSMLMSKNDSLFDFAGRPYYNASHLQRYGRLMEEFFAYQPSAGILSSIGPCLIITGALDTTIHPSSSLRLHQRLEKSSLAVSEEGDHFMLFNNAACIERVASYLLECMVGRE